MDAQEIKKYVESLPRAVYEYKDEWDTEWATLERKMFLLVGEDSNQHKILTVKANPQEGALYREMYPGLITHGYHMNKVHWISIWRDGSISEDLIKELIFNSYWLIRKALPRKIRDTFDS